MSEWQPLPDGTYRSENDVFGIYRVLGNGSTDAYPVIRQGDNIVMLDMGDAICRLVERAEPQPYSHRNGETEPPTIEGWYAIQHPQAWNWQGSTFVFVERNMDGIDVYCTGQDDPIGYDQMDSRIRWYGPIVPPWEVDK